MRAWVLERLEGPEALALKEVPDPQPAPGEVVLRLEALGLNFADALLLQGAYLLRLPPPFVPGMEAVGRVVAGPEELKGRRFAVLLGQGGLAEYVRAPLKALLPLPEGLSPEEAAAFPVSFLTAYLSLSMAGAKPGERLLVEAASGALGTALVQVGKALGLRVLAAASRREKLALPLSLGADAAATYEELAQAARAWGGVDLAVEVRGRVEEVLPLLAPFGRVVFVGAAEGEAPPVNPVLLMRRNLSLMGFWLAPWLEARPSQVEEALAFLLPLLGSRLRPQVGPVFPFARAKEAFAALLDRGHQGKVVVLGPE
ncbi:NADPH:quinone oxidoreductase family protein [Thermus filiformis]|uniref:Quinone oxidoreductase n=1 Tax=Thermus filiformis TaxID=276 RepID=A0A0A2WTJ4_THEFI|nr:NADPH:quinone oxidoreductase family protein [Thermus filiformis]KGQ21615.1 quinone oxidoreductase [Thermus filiformis]